MNKTLQTIKSLLSPKKKSRLPIPTTDIHTHILPGVDDGFTRIEDSVEALRRLQALGVKEVVLTPHMHADVYWHTNEKLVRERYAELLTQIPEDLTIKTSLAAEYMILDGFDDRAEDPELLTYEDNSILIEMSYMFKSPNLEHTVFNLAMSGKKPILAHPERYAYLADKLHTFDSLLDRGCTLQMNLVSLTGIYGPESMKILRYLLDRGMYKYIATDLHSLAQLDYIRTSEIDATLAAKASALL